MAGPPEFALRLLGRPSVAGLAEGAVFPAKGFQLLALACLSPGRCVARKQAAAMLWDSASDELALTNLRQLLARLRRLLPGFERYLFADTRDLKVGAAQSEIDLCGLLDQPLTAPQLETGGELLAGMDDLAEPFEQWLRAERIALRERFFAAASAALIEMTRYGRAPKQGLDEIAQRMLTLEPEREASFRALIEAYGRAGHFEEAGRRHQALLEMLAREHGGPPGPDTRAVIRRVFAGRGLADETSAPVAALPSQPRIAFLAPRWLEAGEAAAGLLKALIEDVANELARYRSFIMLAPHSSFQVDHDSGVPLDNHALNAGYTVSGFVKPGGSVLSLRMVNCASREIVWAGEFGFSVAELIRSFRTLVVRVAASLASDLERDLRHEMQKTTNNVAYLNYLDGNQWLQTCDLKRVRRARKCFAAAIAEDGRFSASRAGIVQSLYLEWLVLGGSDPHILITAREQVERVLETDPHSALGYWMKAVVSLYQHDFDASEESFDQALTLSPNSADLLVDYGDALGHTGDAELGWELFQRAVELNPLPPDHYWWTGASIAFSKQDYAAAIAFCNRLGNDEPVLRLLAASHALGGDRQLAQSYGRRLKQAYPGETAYGMAKIQPHRTETSLQPFIEGLRLAGVN